MFFFFFFFNLATQHGFQDLSPLTRDQRMNPHSLQWKHGAATPRDNFLKSSFNTHTRVYILLALWRTLTNTVISQKHYRIHINISFTHGPTPTLVDWKAEYRVSATAAAKSLQSCLTLCDPTDGSPPGSTIPGILQARTLEWVAISFSNTWKWKVKVKSLSRAWLLGPHGLQPSRLLRPWDFPGKSTGVGCHCSC